ncbi:XdhC family protein [bacterium]|nr:XdhC family protein [bacterium]
MGGVEFHRRVVALLEAGTQFATARLVRVAGHSPQDPGAAMIVHPDGGIEFTIGGGPFEAEVIQDCVALLGRGEAVLQRTYDLTREALGMDCAGRVTVLLEAPLPTERLVVFGGGHVGARIAAAGAALGLFQVWVIDDREAFADAALHPGAHRVVHTDREWVEGVPELGPHDHVVVVTRCHPTDAILVERHAGAPVAFLGMLGSKAKVATMWAELKAKGVDPGDLARVHAPVGSFLGAKAPGEIAASVLAQIVSLRRRKSGPGQHSATGAASTERQIGGPTG